MSTRSLLVWALLPSSLGLVAGDEATPPVPGAAFGFHGLELYKVDSGASRLRVADVNGDGLTDLAIVNNSRATIDFYLQKRAEEIASTRQQAVEFDNINEIASDARFRKESLLTEKRVFDLLVEDLNGDATPDLAYHGDPKELVIVFRAPAGGAESRQKFSVPEARAFGRGLGAGDLNGDGKKDLALLGTGSVHLLYQGPDGKLTEPVEVPSSEKSNSGLLVKDLNGDGKDDLVLFSSGAVEPIRVRLQGPGGPGPEVPLETPAFRAALVTDLAGDARAEIALVQGATGRLVVFQLAERPHEGAAPFGRMRLFPLPGAAEAGRQHLTLGDVDGDGRTDVLETSGSTAQLRLYRQGADGSLLAPLTFPTLAGAGATRLGDLDGDGKAEVVLLSADEKSVGISRWDGSRLTFPTSAPLKGKPTSCDLLDLDGKPGLELAVALDDEGSSTVAFLGWADPLAQLGEPLELKGAKDPPDRLRFFDVDQDGRADLLVGFPYEPMRMYLQAPAAEGGALPMFQDVSGQKNFGRGLLQGAVPSSLATGDLDRDGKPELFLAKKNFARAFRVTPRKVLEAVDQFNARDPAAEIVGVAVGNFEGDEHPEIALLDKARSQILFLTRSAMGTYAVSSDLKIPAFTYRGIATTDLNGDGKLDLFVEGDDRFGVLYSGGKDLHLERVTEYESDLKDAYLDTLAAGDLNGDGRADLVVSELRSHLLEILSQDAQGGALRRSSRFKVFEDSQIGGDVDEKRMAREPREIAIADVTGDGKRDVILLIHDRIIVYPQE